MDNINQIVDAIPVGIIEIGLDGKIHYMNSRFSQLLGYKSQEILYENISPHIYEDFNVLSISTSIDSFPENTCPTLTFITKEKVLIKLNIRWSKVLSENNELIGICAAATRASDFYNDNNTEKKDHELFETRLLIRNSKLATINENLTIKLKEKEQIEAALLQSEEKFGSLFESAPNAIIVAKDNGKIFMSNLAAVKMFGYDKNELNHISIENLISESDDTKMWGITSSGTRIPVIVNLAQIEILGIFYIGTYISQRIETEEKSGDIPDLEKYIQLSKVVEQTDGLVSITNKNGIFEYVNPSFEKFTGYSKDEILGKSSNILKSGKHDNQFYSTLWETVKSGDVFTSEFYNKKKSGEIYIEEKTISPIKDDSGNILHYVSTGNDISIRKKTEEQLLNYKNYLEELVEKRTEDYKKVQMELVKEINWRKEAEEELRVKEERLHLAIEASEEGLWDLNIETNKIYYNEIFQNMIGIEKPVGEGLWLSNYHMFIYEKDREKYLEEFEKHLNNITTIFSFEHRIKDTNGKIKWVATKGKVVLRDENNAPLRFIGKIEDISLRKKSEALFRRSFHRAKELANIKSRFVSMVSHEFRTPLATVLSSTEILELYSNQISENERNDYFRKIENSIEYLSSLLNDIITINKGELNKITYNNEEFDIIDFCRKIIAEVKLINPTSNIKFISDLECNFIKSDKKLLTQMISNLLNNAFKYNINDNEIMFKISFEKELMIMKFRDHGIGISLKDQDKLFEPFFRGSNVNNISGTGLGLAIVKKSVEILNGEIKFKSKINAGTMFIVKIPASIIS
ncbi:MAG: PAS domain-containing sensor histidine kinase [Ignavibacteriaceae bacterium]